MLFIQPRVSTGFSFPSSRRMWVIETNKKLVLGVQFNTFLEITKALFADFLHFVFYFVYDTLHTIVLYKFCYSVWF